MTKLLDIEGRSDMLPIIHTRNLLNRHLDFIEHEMTEMENIDTEEYSDDYMTMAERIQAGYDPVLFNVTEDCKYLQIIRTIHQNKSRSALREELQEAFREEVRSNPKLYYVQKYEATIEHDFDGDDGYYNSIHTLISRQKLFQNLSLLDSIHQVLSNVCSKYRADSYIEKNLYSFLTSDIEKFLWYFRDIFPHKSRKLIPSCCIVGQNNNGYCLEFVNWLMLAYFSSNEYDAIEVCLNFNPADPMYGYFAYYTGGDGDGVGTYPFNEEKNCTVMDFMKEIENNPSLPEHEREQYFRNYLYRSCDEYGMKYLKRILLND